MKNQAKILAPFNKEDAKFLNEVDYACKAVMEGMEKEATAASLAGKEVMELDMETIAWLKFIRGFGILYNRAIDSGWLRGVVTDNLPIDLGKPRE